ncbi:pyrroline-5-carboxylate reductase [Orenia metallireducens]|uniref:Pyrroline-5-carboxylate reductase n=1 Tax=Orenia metallireducens TaxID=1413210 RepID=A0A285HQH4_9FIRM|nr:pyrroline-5-carboxylate reductase [Orenia metallireducens]PRX25077.1 pyrroline-5-carboxylate reductase [Orenia metallireducens]SNY37958.1 pyrroline-5-carboxylate reductase [Orenia metallireducens]
MKSKKSIGFIGAGAMAEALIKGLLKSEVYHPSQIHISDIRADRLEELKESYGIETSRANQDLVKRVDYLILAVKPKVIPIVLKQIGEDISKSQKLFSLAAGVNTVLLEKYLKEEVAVIRLMPNTPALIGEGAIAYCLGTAAQDDSKLVEQIFGTVGRTLKVEEELMDAVTGLSGSGPAYIYLIIEALADAGVNVGLSRDDALSLVLQTIIGSAKMVLELGAHPGQLKDMVTSPGGTTITGLKVLEREGVRSALYQAVEAATIKSKELRGEK